MPTLEEITYDAGRHALSVQEAFVAGIRQRTGTLLAAHALVASFLGGTSLSGGGAGAWAWLALVSLLLGLVIAAALLAPWRLIFALDARRLHDTFYERAAAEAAAGGLGWLLAVAYDLQSLHERNEPKVRRMSLLLGALAALVVIQTLGWLGGLA